MKKLYNTGGKKQPPVNRLAVGHIEITVVSRPKAGLRELEGALKPGKKSVSAVREMRHRDYGREKKRLGSD